MPSPTQWPPFARRISTSFFMTVLSRTVLGEPGRLGFVASSTLLCSAIYLEQVRSLRIPYIGTQTRSEEHTSELQSLMRISYAVFCLKKKNDTYLTKKRTHLRQI